MVILPDCLLSLSQPYPKGRHGKWMQAADEFVSFSAPRMEAADAARHGKPNRSVRCRDIASLRSVMFLSVVVDGCGRRI